MGGKVYLRNVRNRNNKFINTSVYKYIQVIEMKFVEKKEEPEKQGVVTLDYDGAFRVWKKTQPFTVTTGKIYDLEE